MSFSPGLTPITSSQSIYHALSWHITWICPWGTLALFSHLQIKGHTYEDSWINIFINVILKLLINLVTSNHWFIGSQFDFIFEVHLYFSEIYYLELLVHIYHNRWVTDNTYFFIWILETNKSPRIIKPIHCVLLHFKYSKWN